MKVLSPKYLFTAAAIVIFSAAAFAQNPAPSERGQIADDQVRPNLMRELGLRQEQVRRIRMLNRDRKPLMEAAQKRLRNANRELDAAIYGDSLDEAVVAARLRAFQEAQAEIATIRFQSELSLRNILDPDQLQTFRQLRARVERDREDAKKRRQQQRQDRPLRRIRQLPGQKRVN